MSEAAAGYWCHQCMDAVEPVAGDGGEEEITCPICGGGFVEEMGDGGPEAEAEESDDGEGLLGSHLLRWLAPSEPSDRRSDEEEDDDDDEEEDEEEEGGGLGVDGDDRLMGRRRARIFGLLQSILDDLRVTLNHAASISGMDADDIERERRERRAWREQQRRERLGDDADAAGGGGGGEGDRIGEGLDMLLQRLVEGEAGRYGTPPAKKEAVEALPVVRIEEAVGCTVCLEVFAVGDEAKQMPCQHTFHAACILPWLALHSSCPVCRFQLPAGDDGKEEAAAEAELRRASSRPESPSGDSRHSEES